jgi:hypothetical protein
MDNVTRLLVSTNMAFAATEMLDHPEYVEFMRRVPAATKNEIERKMAALQNSGRLSEELLRAINKRWGVDDPIIMDPDMPYIALYAFRQNKISRMQIGTLLHFWAAIQHHQEAGRGPFAPEVFDFFNADGSVNQEALEILKETFTYPPASKEEADPFDEKVIAAYRASKVMYPFAIELETEEELARFVEEVRKLPRSEQQFFRIPCLLPLDGETIVETLREKGGYKAFGLVNDNKKVILETMGLSQAFVNAIRNGEGSEYSVQLNIVIGLSSDEDIEKNGLTATRDVAVHFPGVELPREADGRDAFWIYFTKHDVFHAASQKVMGSYWSSQIVNLWYGLPFLGTPAEQQTQERVKQFSNDLDLPALRHPKVPGEKGFWESFMNSFSITMNSSRYTKLSPETEDAVLRQLFSRLVEQGDRRIGIGPETEFSTQQMNPFTFRINSYFLQFRRTRIGKQVPKIWKEQKVASARFLPMLKADLKGEKSKDKVAEKVEPWLPLLSKKQAWDLLEFSLENEMQATSKRPDSSTDSKVS